MHKAQPNIAIHIRHPVLWKIGLSQHTILKIETVRPELLERFLFLAFNNISEYYLDIEEAFSRKKYSSTEFKNNHTTSWKRAWYRISRGRKPRSTGSNE